AAVEQVDVCIDQLVVPADAEIDVHEIAGAAAGPVGGAAARSAAAGARCLHTRVHIDIDQAVAAHVNAGVDADLGVSQADADIGAETQPARPIATQIDAEIDLGMGGLGDGDKGGCKGKG